MIYIFRSNNQRRVVSSIFCRYVNYYQILEVPRTAKKSDIKKAYINKAKQCHPDLFPGNEQKTQEFQKLQEAYNTLSNDLDRARYDSTISHNQIPSRTTYRRTVDRTESYPFPNAYSGNKEYEAFRQWQEILERNKRKQNNKHFQERLEINRKKWEFYLRTLALVYFLLLILVFASRNKNRGNPPHSYYRNQDILPQDQENIRRLLDRYYKPPNDNERNDSES